VFLVLWPERLAPVGPLPSTPAVAAPLAPVPVATILDSGAPR
jgi:hypothetical protein